MRMTGYGRSLLAQWEGGPKLKSYLDSGGVPTIGVGHALTLSERRSGKIHIGERTVRYADGISLEDAKVLFAQDLEPVEEAISAAVKVPISQNQFAALCAFVFNVGINAFLHARKGKPSGVLEVLNAGRPEDVPAEMRGWVYDDGKVIQGLVNRRSKEVALWCGPGEAAVA